MELSNAVKMILEVQNELQAAWTSDMILNCATRIYNASKMAQKGSQSTNGSEMSTEKQRKLLKQLNFDGIAGNLTKKEASAAISALLAKENE